MNKVEVENIKIIHINVAGICDKFYDTMFESIRNNGNIEQTVFIPYSNHEYSDYEISRFTLYNENIKVILSPIKKKMDKILFFKKIKKYELELNKNIDNFNNYNLIHAHSLFSDGGVAYRLYMKYRIPYIISVRATDIEIFLKYFIHTRDIMKKILEHASKIIFINPNIEKDLLKTIKDVTLKNKLRDKSIIIPNAIDNFWLNNSYSKNKNSLPKIHLIQVGKLNKIKNQMTSLKVVEYLKTKGFDVFMDFIGEGDMFEELQKNTVKLNINNNVCFHGFIKEKSKLINLYRNADFFILPSISETFGIAYIEAMSQGLPVIYSKNQGIDGYYIDGEVGFSVKSKSFKHIATRIIKISEDYFRISCNCSRFSKTYNWEDISNKFFDEYKIAILKNDR